MLHGDSSLPALGMSVELTLTIVALHTVWSVCVPIAIIETLAQGRSTTPWVRTPGLIVTAFLYAAGGVLVFFGNYSEEHFVASPAQLGGVAVVIVALVVLAFRMRFPTRRLPGRAPAAWIAGAFALLGTSAYWAPAALTARVSVRQVSS